MSLITSNPIVSLVPSPGTVALYYLADGAAIFGCIGSPEGIIFANARSIAITELGAVYSKTTNGTNTGWALISGGGGGAGTVTSVSAGNLSQLFATNVATPTTTPAITFAPVSQLQNLVFASPNGAPGNPTFRALLAADLPIGTGTVTSFSAGDLSPLFATTEATPTTTPALSFAQISQSPNLFFASPDGVSGNPLFRAIVATDIVGLAIAPPPAAAIPFNNGSNIFAASGNLTFDTLTNTLLLGSTGASNTGLLQFRNSNGFRIRFTTNNPVDQNITLPDALPTLNQVLAATAVSGSNVIWGYSTPLSGTVTSFSAGDLSPLFTTTEATPTTTPALSFVQISQAQNLVFASPNAASGNPTFRTLVAGDLPAGLPTGLANPTASIGLAAINGSATTAMRSDAAQALDQTIAPTWTGVHTHSLSNAAAWSIGPNGNTNPVIRVITNTASQADGISIDGKAAGSGIVFTALSSGSNAPITFAPKGSGNVILGDASQASITLASNLSGASDPQILFKDAVIDFAPVGGTITQRFSNTLISVGSGIQIGWSSAASGVTSNDSSFVRNGAAAVIRAANGGTGIGSLIIAQNGLTALGQFHVEPTATGTKPIYVNSPSGTTVSLIQLQNNLSDRFVVSPTGLVTNSKGGVQAVRSVGQISCDVTDHNNGTTAATDLATYAMPANTMNVNTDVLRARFALITAGNINNKTIAVVFGSTTIFSSGALALNAANIEIIVSIARVSSAVQRCTVSFISNSVLLADTNTYTDTTEDLTTILTLKTVGTGGATNDITNKLAVYEILPA